MYTIYAMAVCAAVLGAGITVFILIDRKANKTHREWLDGLANRRRQDWDHI
jgi:hypothetical protein